MTLVNISSVIRPLNNTFNLLIINERIWKIVFSISYINNKGDKKQPWAAVFNPLPPLKKKRYKFLHHPEISLPLLSPLPELSYQVLKGHTWKYRKYIDYSQTGKSEKGRIAIRVKLSSR